MKFKFYPNLSFITAVKYTLRILKKNIGSLIVNNKTSEQRTNLSTNNRVDSISCYLYTNKKYPLYNIFLIFNYL